MVCTMQGIRRSLIISNSKTKLKITLSRNCTFCTFYGTHTNLNINPLPIALLTMNIKTNALATAIRQCTNSTSSTSTSNMRVVYIGKDQQPVNLPQMAFVNSQSWKKSASFETLTDGVYSLVDAHYVAGIIALVGNEISIDTGASYQEAQSSSKLIVNSFLNPMFLDPVAFLKSDDDEVKIGDPSDKTQRPLDITYVRFRCTIHGSSIDPRVIKALDLSFNFCLRLP